MLITLTRLPVSVVSEIKLSKPLSLHFICYKPYPSSYCPYSDLDPYSSILLQNFQGIRIIRGGKGYSQSIPEPGLGNPHSHLHSAILYRCSGSYEGDPESTELQPNLKVILIQNFGASQDCPGCIHTAHSTREFDFNGLRLQEVLGKLDRERSWGAAKLNKSNK